MEKLIEKVNNLKLSLDNEDSIKKIKELNKAIMNDKKLIELITEYKNKPSSELKDNIYNNKLYQKYKESETDINILIMSINTKLKDINNRSNCI